MAKVLLVAFYFPPAGGVGVLRMLKLAEQLPELGVETHVLAPVDPKWVHRDEQVRLPSRATIHRVAFIGPRGRRPADELHRLRGLRRLLRRTSLFGRRLLIPDENVGWILTAIPAAVRLVRTQGIDVVVTSSPPNSVHLVGWAARAITGVTWVADLRDSLAGHPHRAVERRLVRVKERSQDAVAQLTARSADAIVAVSDAIADEIRARAPAGRVIEIANGCDFDDFAGLRYQPGPQFRITHTGSFFGKRDPRPFLTAMQQVDGVVARFVGDFRPADHEWASSQGLEQRLELISYAPRSESLRLQRESDALLLLIPEAGGRGSGILSGKVFEYLAAERPILALVPPDGKAAQLLREIGTATVVAPDDIPSIARALAQLYDRWMKNELPDSPLDQDARVRLSRRARSNEYAQLLRDLCQSQDRIDPRRPHSTKNDTSPDRSLARSATSPRARRRRRTRAAAD